MKTYSGPLEKIDNYRWRIPKNYLSGMRVDGIIYADDKMIKDIKNDNAPEQVANVATLPGIVKYSIAMPDIHWGYGFCIGGVAATDIEKGGVISPGGVGYDINCGVRLLKTDLFRQDILKKQKDLMYAMYNDIPAGVGSEGKIRVSHKEEKEILIKGAKWALSQGYATKDDIEHTEEEGAMEGAGPDAVSDRAYERGRAQSGTLGSGNHFIEIQSIADIYDEKAANIFGLSKDQVTVMIHSGSRGFGYQICDDYAKDMVGTLSKYSIKVPDRQLACAPFNSGEGQQYFKAMKCAANYAWNNRQCLMHLVRLSFEKVFSKPWQNMGMNLIYDVAHNIAKLETHEVNGKKTKLCVHRKGATRAFMDQPIIIPGDMQRSSYLLIGTKKAMDETFGSTCHGAGRQLSRTAAIKKFNEHGIRTELERNGILVMAKGRGTIAEEAPLAYKDVNEVVDIVHNAGISKKVCRMRPLVVLKG
ncbi:MAG: RtcB family protein [Candidatus Omnitrophica bacterium]|nr:RtcB family protein [Candidatus Omnitrophota bacterium]